MKLTARIGGSRLRSIGFMMMNTCWFLWVRPLSSRSAALQKYCTYKHHKNTRSNASDDTRAHLDYMTQPCDIRHHMVSSCSANEPWLRPDLPIRVCRGMWRAVPMAGQAWRGSCGFPKRARLHRHLMLDIINFNNVHGVYPYTNYFDTLLSQ